MEQFPPNSQRARDRGSRVEQVATGRKRRQPLGKQFRQTFFSTDARSALDYMIIDTVIPGIKEIVLDSVNNFVERRLYGENRRYRRSPPSGPYGHVNYNRMSQPTTPRAEPTRMLSRPSRMRHAFDEIVLDTRMEAEEVLDRMYDQIARFEEVSVADLYELTGIQSSHTDKKWGWEDLRGSSVGRVRGGGYLLQLPEPTELR